MGTSEKERSVSNNNNESYREPKKIVQICLAWLGSFLVSMAGGLVLACWISKYHPTNKQLWMVPFGLVMFTTPILVWFVLVCSDICNLNCNGDVSWSKQQVPPLDRSIPDLER